VEGDGGCGWVCVRCGGGWGFEWCVSVCMCDVEGIRVGVVCGCVFWGGGGVVESVP
jgi:hypothetical protein